LNQNALIISIGTNSSSNLKPLGHNVDKGNHFLVRAPYGDMYFRFMRDYIKAYKRGKKMPKNLIEALDKGSDREDFDMDGIPNKIEGSKDTDGDGISDQWDLDSNNDGIPDSREPNTE